MFASVASPLPEEPTEDMNYEDVKNTCRNMFAFVENMCGQAKKEMEVIDATDFNRITTNFFCKKSLWFIDFMNTSLASYQSDLKDAQEHLESPSSCNRQANAAKKFGRSKLSLRRCCDEAETQDTFPDPMTSSQCDSPSLLQFSTFVNSMSHASDPQGDNKKKFFDYLSLVRNCAPSFGSSDMFESQLKSELDDYETFEDKKEIDAVLDRLLGDLIVEENSKGGARKDSDDLDDKKDESEEELSPEEQRKIQRDAIEELKNIGYDTSDLVSSSDTGSDESESEEDIPVRKKNPNPGGEEVLIETEFLLDIIKSEPVEIIPPSTSFDEQHRYDRFDLKECSVLLEVITEKVVEKKSACDKELAEIERLTNLASLERRTRRRGSSSASSDNDKERKLKRRRVSPPIERESSSSDETDFDCDRTAIINEPVDVKVEEIVPKIDSEKVMQEILNYGFGDLDDSDREVNSTDSTEELLSSESDVDVNVAEKASGSKSNNGNNKMDPELLQRRKWRHDQLLTGRITDSSSSDEEVDAKGKSRPVEGETNKHKCEDVEFVDVSEMNGGNPIALSSDSENSDVELVEVLILNRRRKSGKSGDAEDDDETKKGGRRNIRAVKSDEALDEATKRAAKEEGDRAQRILQKQRNLDEALSQASTELLHGLVLDVDEETNEPIVSLNLQLTNKLKPHQREGVRFMWNTCYESVKRTKNCEGTGCILAHCMGLGKTLQVVTLIHTLFTHPATSTRHVLIVCPLSTVLNWEHEFKIGLDDVYEPGPNPVRRFCISNRNADKVYRVSVIEDWWRSSGVLILGYEAYQTLMKLVPEQKWAVLTEKQQHVRDALCDPGPDLVICDEGHLLKNGKNIRTKSLIKVRTKRRIILTGTPLQNNLIEYYYMVKFVKPNLLGTLPEYSNRFVNPITNGQYDDSTPADIELMRKRSHVLHKILNQTVQRYEVTELKNYLPDMTDYVVNVLLHPVQVELYKTYLQKVCCEGRGSSKKLFYDFNNLRTVWTHPYLLHLVETHKAQFDKKTKLEVDTINLDPNEITVVPDQPGGDGPQKNYEELPRGWWKELCPEDYNVNVNYGPKFKVLFGILDECVRAGDKVLVFSNSLAELDCIEYFLKTIGTSTRPSWRRKEDYLRMDGTVPPDTRMKYCNYFNDPANVDVKVFLISHRVGGLGLNLVAANRVVLMDVNFNPAYDLQSIFRMYRFGQKKQCYVYRLVAKGTMEEVNYERSITKLAVAGRVVDQMQMARHYKSSDLQKMYRFQIFTKESIKPYGIPSDDILKKVLQNFNADIHSFHEHQALLENLTEEVLNENEMKKAWEEFNEEQHFKRWGDRERGEPSQTGSQAKNAAAATTAAKGGGNRIVMKRVELPADLIFKTYKKKYTCVALSKTANDFAANSKIAHNKEGVNSIALECINLPPQQQEANVDNNFKDVMLDRSRIIDLLPADMSVSIVDHPNKHAENVASVSDLERADLLEKISCNSSLTLSTVLVEPVKTHPVSEKSYGNVIEID